MIDPRNMTWQDWASSVILSVNDAWSFGVPPEEADWQGWAIGLLRASPFTQQIIPDPYQFSDWREWGMRVYPMLEGTSS
jgi:hypothetical protein